MEAQARFQGTIDGGEGYEGFVAADYVEDVFVGLGVEEGDYEVARLATKRPCVAYALVFQV